MKDWGFGLLVLRTGCVPRSEDDDDDDDDDHGHDAGDIGCGGYLASLLAGAGDFRQLCSMIPELHNSITSPRSIPK